MENLVPVYAETSSTHFRCCTTLAVYDHDIMSYLEAQRLLDSGPSSLVANRVLQPPGMELPRLTATLRSTGGEVSYRPARKPLIVDSALLVAKKRKRREEEAGERSWGRATAELLARCGRRDAGKVGGVF